MKGKAIVVLLTLVVLLSSALLGCTTPTPAPTSPQGEEASIVNDYPDLRSLVDFVGEENLSVLSLVGFRAADRAMEELKFERGDPDVLALTDAGYIANIGKYTTEKALDGVMITSGASPGKGNLVNVHKAYNSPLWFAFFDKEGKDCIYLEVKSDVLQTYLDREKTGRDAAVKDFLKLRDDEVFVKTAKENINAERLLGNPEAWQQKMVAKVFGGNEFSLITIANLWAMGLPNDFLRVVQLHDHICPGLLSGYLITEYVKEKLPASDPRQEYTIIAIPPWCKDDALIQLFETNVGHKKLYVMNLTAEQKKQLPQEAKNVANIIIRWETGAETGDGIVVAFDWDKAYEGIGTNAQEFTSFDTYQWWRTRLKMDIWIMDYLDEPEVLISTIKTFTVANTAEINKLTSAGSNPLVELGIMP
jgi:formylmethanofuran dehydrogenase subunit E-like metal-binding protein